MRHRLPLPGAFPVVLAALAAACGGGRSGGGPVPDPPALDPVRERIADATARAKERENAGDRAGAEAAWEEVLAERPGHGSALYATARLRRARGDLAGSLLRLEALRAAEPNAGRGHLLAAEILSDPASGDLRDLARAEESAAAALARNPEESGPHLALGRVLLLRGRGGEASGRLEVAARMNPRDGESRSLLGVLAFRAGRDREARRWFREALRGGQPAGVAATGGGAPGEGDTRVSLDPARAPTAGELRAVAGLAALGEGVEGAREGGAAPDSLRASAAAALAARGTGEAILDTDADGAPDAAAVAAPDGTATLAVGTGGGSVRIVYR